MHDPEHREQQWQEERVEVAVQESGRGCQCFEAECGDEFGRHAADERFECILRWVRAGVPLWGEPVFR